MKKSNDVMRLTLADFLERLPHYGEGRVITISSETRDEIVEELRRFEKMVQEKELPTIAVHGAAGEVAVYQDEPDGTIVVYVNEASAEAPAEASIINPAHDKAVLFKHYGKRNDD